MVNDDQITAVWEGMIGAEVRALYFADLTSSYSRRKQIITGCTFFLSSGAAATVIARSPAWLPILLSLVVAVVNAYAMAWNLDSSIRTLSKLHYSWNQLATDYERLWNHFYDEGSEERYDLLVAREADLSEMAATDAPNDQRRMTHWQEEVFRQRHLSPA